MTGPTRWDRTRLIYFSLSLCVFIRIVQGGEGGVDPQSILKSRFLLLIFSHPSLLLTLSLFPFPLLLSNCLQDKFVHHDGKYELLKTDYKALAAKSQATWQYYMHAPQDGKKIGWYDYDAAAAG